jgi:hypothetical protein
MKELILNILCMAGAVYFFWRFGTFLKTLLGLIWNHKNSNKLQNEDKISSL